MTAAYFGVGGYGGGSASVIHADSANPDHIVVPDAQFLFTAHFHRAGPDLVLTGGDGHKLVIPDYFASEHHPSLIAPNGASLSAHLVDLLAGSAAPNEYAQAGQFTPPEPIGRCEKVVGTVTVIRNGVAVALNVGDAVYKSDVVQTGANSSAGVGFPDGSALNLVANTRMALNEYSYDPNSNSNSALFNLVEGGLSFVAGKVAHTGDMKIGTPIATMGIRGTAGWLYEEQVANITAQAGNVTLHFAAVFDSVTNTQSTYSLYAVDANGEMLHDANGNLIKLADVSSLQNGLVTTLTGLGINALPDVSVAPPDLTQQQFQNIVVPQVLNMAIQAIQQYQNQQNQQSNPQSNPGSTGSGGPPSTPPTDNDNTHTEQINLPNGPTLTFTATGGTPTDNTLPPTTPPPQPPTTTTNTQTDTGNPTWTGGGSTTDFNDPLNWSGGQPGTGNSPIVNTPNAHPTVSQDTTIGGLTVGPGDSVEVQGDPTLIINGSGHVVIEASGGVAGEIKASGQGARVIITDQSVDDQGIIHADDGGAITIGSHVTIETGGTVEAIGDGNATVIAFGSGVTMDAGASVEASGNGASVAFDGGVTIGAGATVEASGDGASVFITNVNGPEVVNAGVIEASDGGAVTIFDVQVENAGGVIEAMGADSMDLTPVTLSGSDIVGGTLETGSTGSPVFGEIEVGPGLEATFFDGSTSAGAVTVDAFVQVDDGASLDLLGTIAGNGTIDVVGGGTLTLSGATVQNLNILNDGTLLIPTSASGPAATLTNVTVYNSGQIEVHGTLDLNGGTISGGTIDLALGTASPQPIEIAVPGYYAIGPEVSANGQFVAFIASTGLPGQGDGDTNGLIELYNVAAGGQPIPISQLVPQADLHDGEVFGNVPSLSDNGHLVVFEGKYTDNFGPTSEIFLYNSQAAPGSQITLVRSGAGQATISGNGAVIAAEGHNSGNGGTHVLLMNDAGVVQTEITGDPSYNPSNNSPDSFGNVGSAYNPSLSDDGRYVAFWSTSSEIAVINGPTFATGNSTGAAEVYVYDTLTHTLREASGTLGGQQGNGNSGTLSLTDDGSSWAPSISGSGRFVVFQSTADNLVSGVGDANNDISNIFLYDSRTGTITAVTDANGLKVTGDSVRPDISVDGKSITFASDDSDLPGYNGGWQTYMVAIDPVTGTLSAPELLSAGFPAADNGQNNLASSASDGGGVAAFGGAVLGFNTDQGQATIGNGTITFSGLSLSDFDTASDTLTLTISVEHGTLVAAGSSGPGQQTLTITGTLAQIEAALQTGVTYTPGSPPSVSDALSLQVTDQTAGATASFVSSFNPGATDPSQLFNGQPGTTGQYDIFLSEQQTINVTADTRIDGGAQIEGGLIALAAGVTLTLDGITDTDTSIHDFNATVAFTGSSTLDGTGIFGTTNQSNQPNSNVTIGSGVTLTLDDVVFKNIALTVDSDGTTPAFQIDAGHTFTWAGSSSFSGSGSVVIENNGHIIHDGMLDVELSQVTFEGSGVDTFNGGNSGTAPETLINDGTTLDGFGTFGSRLTIVNESGSFDADVAGHALVLNTGKTIINNGSFIADGGILKVFDTVSGTGSATIEHGGTLEIGNAYSQTITFNGAGTLQLDHQLAGDADAYTVANGGLAAAIHGVTAGDVIDLANFGAQSTDTFQVNATYDPGSGTTTLTVTDTAQGGGVESSAPLTLWGDYSNPDEWAAAYDGHGGIDVTAVSPPVPDDWIGPMFSSGNWGDSGNWDNGVPGTNAEVTISVSGAIVMLDNTDEAATVASLSISNGATLEVIDNSLSVTGSVQNYSSIVASGGFIDFLLDISGGHTTISDGGKIEYGWSSDVDTTFSGDGTLVLDHQNQSDANYSVAQFTGTLHGFGSGDTIDLTDLAYAAGATVTWDDGTLTVDSNGQMASVALDGTYSQGDFALSHDNGSGTALVWVDTIADGATFELATPAADNVVFDTGYGKLILDDPAHFTGVISGIIGSGDVLDVKGFNAATTTATTGAGSFDDATGLTTLTVTDSSDHQTTTFELAGDLSGSSWTVSDDGKGGADIVDPPAASTDSHGSNGFMPSDEQITFGPNGEVTYTIDSGTTLSNATPNLTTTVVNGNGTVVGDANNDSFVFQPGMGAETIANFNLQHDTLSFEHFSDVQTVQQLQSLITTDADGDAAINLGHSDSVTLAGVTTAQLQQAIQSGHVLLH